MSFGTNIGAASWHRPWYRS